MKGVAAGGEGPGVAGDVEGRRRLRAVPDRVGDRGVPRPPARPPGRPRRSLAVAPLGGLAWIGWRERRRAVASGAGRGGAARRPRRRRCAAAAATRAAVRGGVDRLIAAGRAPPVGAGPDRRRVPVQPASALDHVVDRPGEDRDVVGLDRRGTSRSRSWLRPSLRYGSVSTMPLARSAAAIGGGVDAVGEVDRARPRGCARRAWRRTASRPRSPRPSRTGSRRCGRTGSRPTRARRGRASSRSGRRGGTAWRAPGVL